MVLFTIGAFFLWRGGISAIRQVFTNTRVGICLLLAVLLSLYVIEAHRIDAMKQIAIGMLVVALVLEAVDRRYRSIEAASISA